MDSILLFILGLIILSWNAAHPINSNTKMAFDDVLFDNRPDIACVNNNNVNASPDKLTISAAKANSRSVIVDVSATEVNVRPVIINVSTAKANVRPVIAIISAAEANVPSDKASVNASNASGNNVHLTVCSVKTTVCFAHVNVPPAIA